MIHWYLEPPPRPRSGNPATALRHAATPRGERSRESLGAGSSESMADRRRCEDALDPCPDERGGRSIRTRACFVRRAHQLVSRTVISAASSRATCRRPVTRAPPGDRGTGTAAGAAGVGCRGHKILGRQRHGRGSVVELYQAPAWTCAKQPGARARSGSGIAFSADRGSLCRGHQLARRGDRHGNFRHRRARRVPHSIQAQPA